MAKLKLTARAVETAPIGKHSDAGAIGLYLVVSNGGTAKWIFRFRWGARQREMGLGPARGQDAVSLADARAAAMEARRKARAGIDPIAARSKVEVVPTFLSFAEGLIPEIVKEYSNPKHRQQWLNTIKQYCKPIHKMPIDQIAVSDIAGLLRPIWTVKPETASRLRGRIERVLDAATAEGHRKGINPATWKGVLQPLFSSPAKRVKRHHAAMPYNDVPAFMQKLRASEGLASQALELTILAATRTTETSAARIPEFDIAAAIWTIPPERMKARDEHRVPLSSQALALVKSLLAERVDGNSDYLFPSSKKGRPLSNMAMSMTLRRLKAGDATTHGFRSSFRDWAGDQTSFPREVAEAALAHTIKDKAEAAYRRSDAIERRRFLMQAWADYCDGATVGKVIPLRKVQEG